MIVVQEKNLERCYVFAHGNSVYFLGFAGLLGIEMGIVLRIRIYIMRPLVSSLLEAGEQSDFKKWLSKQLVDNGIKITSSSRGGLHIRFAMQGQLADFQKYFKP